MIQVDMVIDLASLLWISDLPATGVAQTIHADAR
jgi:hypothetical protein